VADELFAVLAMWVGQAKRDLAQLFPNIGNFYDISRSSPPLGVIA